MKKALFMVIALVAVFAVTVSQSLAAVWSPTFDSALSGYATVGSVAAQTSHTLVTEGAVVTPPGGGYMAVMTSFGTSTSGFGGTNGSIMLDGMAFNAGDTVQFWWLFDAGDYLPYNDFAIYFQDQLGGSMTTYDLANVASVGNYGNSGWQLFSLTLTSNFYGDIGWICSNAGDTGLDSYLLIANAPEPGTLLLLGSGLLGIAIFSRRRKA